MNQPGVATARQVDAAPTAGPDESLDTLLRGRVQLLQSVKGYRTSVDAMVLAWFGHSQAPTAARAADFGAGSGLVAITLGLALPGLKLTLIERQRSLAARAERNLRLNGLRADIVLHDLAAGPPAALAGLDLVVSNPPYYRAKGRVLPPHPERRDAHYESTAGVERFCAAAAATLAPDGVLCMVYPAQSAHRLVRAYAAAGLGRMQVMAVTHRGPRAPAVRVLVAGRRGPVDVVSLPRFALHSDDSLDHTYAPALERFLAELPERSAVPVA